MSATDHTKGKLKLAYGSAWSSNQPEVNVLLADRIPGVSADLQH